MDPARMRQVESAFAAARSVPPERRDEVLADLCANDPQLRREVERLLEAGEASHRGPLERPPTAAAGLLSGAPPAVAPSGVAVGGKLGRYELLAVLGEGGMGVVYRARQSRPNREVALKVIRPGLATPAILRRFEFESETLGRLQHPGIAQIIEAGTFDSGLGPQPYFAMELVEGRTLLDHANTNRLGQRERLELFRRVCDAVEHAHQRGVIHRDLKPGNILVTPPPQSQPKVLDFGVARAVDSGPNAAGTPLTIVATGDRPLIGTLAYMSPEQVEGDPALIDTRSDVYALGVILYQLLSGRLPHDLASKGLPDALKTLTDSEPPRLGTVAPSARGDLETITTKALEKDRGRRYQSAAALGEDLRRYLCNEPVSARPPSAWYQARKFARRHRALVAGGGAALAALLGGLAATGLALGEASRERDAARAALARQRTTAALLKQMLSGIDPEVARGRDNFIIRRMLDEWAGRIESELKSQPEDAYELRMLVGKTYTALSQLGPAETQLRAALALAEGRWGPESAQGGAALTALGACLGESRGFAESEAALRRAVRVLEKCHGENSADVADALAPLALAVGRQCRDQECETILRRALAIRERHAQADPKALLHARADLAMTLVNVGRYEESTRIMDGTLAEARRVFGPDSPSLVRFLQDKAIAHYRADQYDAARELQVEALALTQRVVPGDSAMAINSLDHLVAVVAAQGDEAACDAYAARSLEMKRRVFGERSLEVSQSLLNTGHQTMSRGKPEAALPLAEQAVEIARAAAPESLAFRDALYFKGQVLTALSRYRDAEPILRELLEAERRVSSPDSRDPVMTGAGLATALMIEAWNDLEAGDTAAARARADEALSLFKESEAYFTRHTEEKAWRRAVAVVNRASAEALARSLGAATVEAVADLLRLSESAFESTWEARAEIAANARRRVLQSMARNIARVARAGARTSEAAPGGDSWAAIEQRWKDRAESIPTRLEPPEPAP